MEITPTHKQCEVEVSNETARRHKEEITILTSLFNVYIEGLNLLQSFTHKEGKNDIAFATLHLVIHSIHSLWCSMRLMTMGYYSQAMALIRTSIEDWFICVDCRSYPKTLEAILEGKHRIPSAGDLSFNQMAQRNNAKKVFDQDYAHTSRFTHPSTLGMIILLDRATNNLKVAPIYEEPIFLDCCELWIRNALRLTEPMEYILKDVDIAKAKEWQLKVQTRLANGINWLNKLRQKYATILAREKNQFRKEQTPKCK